MTEDERFAQDERIKQLIFKDLRRSVWSYVNHVAPKELHDADIDSMTEAFIESGIKSLNALSRN